MHRIWMGTDPHIIMSALGSFLVGAVLVMHIWAYGQFNWPATLKAKYATPPAATR
ncbi:MULTISPECIES: light-harvesting protein [Gemmatimonas]|jgi:hypothetical protein|uniref:light-harvesting protein n=1 Tax=Gemmatimonas TaxID=173479 RepID=UPI0009EEAFDA|nr:light-harvesting protein [Gemmatimonas phototrophica]MCO4100800.1 light-harvesting protein [Gemmatimonas sp.]